MFRNFDLTILAVFLLAQWQIRRMVLAYVGARYSTRIRQSIRMVSLAVGVLAVVGYFLASSELVSSLRLPPKPVAIYSGASVLWLLGSAAACLLDIAFRMVRRRISQPPFDPARRNLIDAAGGALLAAPFAVLGYGAFVKRTDFRVREVDIPLPNLPPDLQNLRLLQLSDIHLSAFLSEPELARVIDASNQTRPHLALVTGDLISAMGDPLDACLRQLSRLRADAGILGCMGNHERYARAEQYATIQGARLGIRFLRYHSHPLRFGNSTLNFVGVDYQPISSRESYLSGAETMILPGAVNILLSHNPDVFPVAAQKGYNLTISGHTHGGQVTVEILETSINPARFFTPYVYGTFRSGDARAYVTRGIGTIGIPARVGAPPEITVLRLRKA